MLALYVCLSVLNERCILWFKGGCYDTLYSSFKKGRPGSELGWSGALQGSNHTDDTDTDEGATQLTRQSMGKFHEIFQQFIQNVCSMGCFGYSRYMLREGCEAIRSLESERDSTPHASAQIAFTSLWVLICVLYLVLKDSLRTREKRSIHIKHAVNCEASHEAYRELLPWHVF